MWRHIKISVRYIETCLNFAIANVKCQQPLRWADPRDRKLNFQRVFAVIDSPTDVKDFPETTFAESQTLDSTPSNVNPASLGRVLAHRIKLGGATEKNVLFFSSPARSSNFVAPNKFFLYHIFSVFNF
jgi:hypothetical protein